MRLLSVLCVVTLFTLYPAPSAVAAITVSFSQLPETISPGQEIELDVTLSGASSESEYYIRGVFYEENTTTYFGSTLNQNHSWNSSVSNFQLFYKLIGNETHKIRFRIETTAQLDSTKRYYFKLARYTSAGSLTWSTQISSPLTVLSPNPTPQPSPTSTPTSSHTVDDFRSWIKWSEIHSCPDDGGSEWIKFYNSSDQSLELDGWQIVDAAGNTHLFSLNFEPNQNNIIKLKNNFLNNSGDTVTLIDQNQREILYTKIPSCIVGSPLEFNNDTWHSTQTPTPTKISLRQPPTTIEPSETDSKTKKQSQTPVEVKRGVPNLLALVPTQPPLHISSTPKIRNAKFLDNPKSPTPTRQFPAKKYIVTLLLISSLLGLLSAYLSSPGEQT